MFQAVAGEGVRSTTCMSSTTYNLHPTSCGQAMHASMYAMHGQSLYDIIICHMVTFICLTYL